MKMNKKYFGNSVLVCWAIGWTVAGVAFTRTYAPFITEVMVPWFPFVLLAWVVVLFQVRFAIEWVINKLWRNHETNPTTL